MRIGRHKFTKMSGVEVGAAVVLALGALWFGIGAWSDYSLYGRFNAAVRAQAAGRPEDVLPALGDIARRRSDYPYPAELAAKRNVDDGTAGALKEALDLYAWLLQGGHDGPSVRLGRAAAYLRLSDLAASNAEREEALGNASKDLAGVGWPEAKIFQGHLLLRRGDTARAQKEFQTAYDEARSGRSEVSLGPLVDLYIGLGICASRQNKHQDAARMFRAARHLMPRERIPFLNSVASISRRYAEESVPREDILRDWEPLIQRARDEWKREFERDSVTYRGLDRAVFHFMLAVGWALTKHNSVEHEAVRAFEDAGNAYSTGTPAELARKDVAIATAYMTQVRPEVAAERRLFFHRMARQSLQQADRALDDPKQNALKAVVLNNMAVYDTEDIHREGKPVASQVARVRELFDRAASLDPANAWIQRNLGAFLIRTGDAAKGRAAWEKSLQLDGKSPGQDALREALGRPDGGGQTPAAPDGEKKE